MVELLFCILNVNLLSDMCRCFKKFMKTAVKNKFNLVQKYLKPIQFYFMVRIFHELFGRFVMWFVHTVPHSVQSFPSLDSVLSFTEVFNFDEVHLI